MAPKEAYILHEALALGITEGKPSQELIGAAVELHSWVPPLPLSAAGTAWCRRLDLGRDLDDVDAEPFNIGLAGEACAGGRIDGYTSIYGNKR